MKILVTGGAGFIGSRLVSNLVDLGQDVVVLDNFSGGRKENLPPDAKVIEGDVRDPDDVRRATNGVNAVFHLAAITDVRNADDDIVYKTNFLGSKNVFEFALARKAKIIFASSAAVYGNLKSLPAKESDRCNPISQYGKSKLTAERYLQQKPPDAYFIARLFNVYGPGSSSAVNKFCKRITDYKDVTVYGSGLQTRDYVYISDVVDALMLGIQNSGIYNVGSGQDISVNALIDLIHRITRCVPTVKNTAPVTGEIARSRADITKIRKFGWSAHVDLETGIRNVLDSIGYKLNVK